MEEKNYEEIKTVFTQMGTQESLFEALYSRVASAFGLTTCEMWIYYFLLIEENGITQRDICSQMSFKKQTVNSAVSKLMKNGMLTLSASDGNSKNKILMLTPEGREFAQRTVNQLLEAELKAAKKFGSKKLSSFCKLRDEYYGTLLREFEKDFLKD